MTPNTKKTLAVIIGVITAVLGVLGSQHVMDPDLVAKITTALGVLFGAGAVTPTTAAPRKPLYPVIALLLLGPSFASAAQESYAPDLRQLAPQPCAVVGGVQVCIEGEYEIGTEVFNRRLLYTVTTSVPDEPVTFRFSGASLVGFRITANNYGTGDCYTPTLKWCGVNWFDRTTYCNDFDAAPDCASLNYNWSTPFNNELEITEVSVANMKVIALYFYVGKVIED